MDIAIEGGEVIPRSLGERTYPHKIIWTPTNRRIANIPSAAYTGETPIHRAQKVFGKFPMKFPMIPRPTPIKDVLTKAFRRVR
ncbi:hypothetical protein KKE60_05925 [Patescibacteria group bacterium]|nr:hypothetical protein [Patescibacteria group bacterium]